MSTRGALGWRGWLVAPVAWAGLIAWSACGEAEPHARVDDGVEPAGTPGPDASSSASCEPSPSAGCPCAKEGEIVACGEVIQKHDGYLSCSQGNRTCTAGLWGSCQGEKVATKAFVDQAYPGKGPLGLSPTPAKCMANPCDPYCVGYEDTASNVLDAGIDSGLVYDGGVTLPGTQAGGYVCTGLAITPGSATATVTSIPPDPAAIGFSFVPAPSTFTVQLLPPGCAPTPSTLWTLDQPGEATISSGGVFNLFDAIPNTVNVTAFASGFKATAPVNVVVAAWDTSLAPAGVTPASFGGTPTVADSITWLYPYDGTVYPLRLTAPMPQWSVATAASAVRVILRYPADGSKFTWSGIQPELQSQPATGIAAQPRGIIPPKVWKELEQAAQGQDAYVSVQRIVGGTLRIENPKVRIRFATGSLRGTVYYNSYGSNYVHNYNPTYTGGTFGAATLAIKPGAAAPVLIAGSDTKCYVCHSVAANGSRLTTTDGFALYNTFQLDLASMTATWLAPNDYRFSWAAISPDGNYLFTNSGPTFASSATSSRFYSLPGNAALAAPGLPVTLRAATPSFSPEGTGIAFNEDSYDGKTLTTVDHVVATHAVSNLQRLATPGAGGVGAGKIYYPAYLPQAAGGDIVYQLETTYNGRDVGGTRSQCDAKGPIACQNEGTHGELWSVDPTTKQSVRLDKLNGLGYVPPHPTYTPNPAADPQFNYEPTVNPQMAGGYAWVVFTSRRRYGNIATINPFWSDPRFQDLRFEPTPKKLWVAAMDPNKPSGVDASYPAFYLPGQELLAGNSRGYWVVDPCIPSGSATTCESNIDCCPGAGVACTQDAPPATTRHCTTNAGPNCTLANGACTMTSQCCGNPTFQCINNTCQPPIPPVNYFPSDFVREYEGVCPVGFHVKWTNFGLEALTPGPGGGGDYTRVDVKAQTADTQATLGAATQVAAGSLVGPPVNQSTAFTNFDIAAAVGSPADQRSWLRITMRLMPTADKLQAPTLVNWHQQYDCLPTE